MTIALTAEHIGRYKDIARLSNQIRAFGCRRGCRLDHLVPCEEHLPLPASDPLADELADDLEKMGPIYVKLGQVFSSRGDLLPPPYVKALTRLQDHNRTRSLCRSRETVEQELGCRLSKAFQEFEEKPVATASLGQVHRAILHNGRPVAVKVQRPGIRKEIAEDMEVLTDIARFADEHTRGRPPLSVCRDSGRVPQEPDP